MEHYDGLTGVILGIVLRLWSFRRRGSAPDVGAISATLLGQLPHGGEVRYIGSDGSSWIVRKGPSRADEEAAA